VRCAVNHGVEIHAKPTRAGAPISDISRAQAAERKQAISAKALMIGNCGMLLA
jgi:hypothetical protein